MRISRPQHAEHSCQFLHETKPTARSPIPRVATEKEERAWIMATMVRACMPLPASPAVPASSAAAAAAHHTDAVTHSKSSGAHVLMLVGSTVTALSKLRPDLNILISSRNRH